MSVGPLTPERVARENRKVPELMGVREVAAEFGIRPNNIDRTAGLPEPCARLQGGRVWRADLIREAAAARRARMGG